MNRPKDLTLRQRKVIWFNGRAYLCTRQAGVTVKGLIRSKFTITLGLRPSVKVWPAALRVIEFMHKPETRKEEASLFRRQLLTFGWEYLG